MAVRMMTVVEVRERLQQAQYTPESVDMFLLFGTSTMDNGVFQVTMSDQRGHPGLAPAMAFAIYDMSGDMVDRFNLQLCQACGEPVHSKVWVSGRLMLCGVCADGAVSNGIHCQ